MQIQKTGPTQWNRPGSTSRKGPTILQGRSTPTYSRNSSRNTRATPKQNLGADLWIPHVQGQMQIWGNQQMNTIHPQSGQILAQDFNTKPHTEIRIDQQINQHGYSIFKYPMELNRRGMARIFSTS